jgi:hypothetical protein
MPSQVVVAFARGNEYEFHVSDQDIAACGREEGNRWLDQEWVDLDCIPTNPVGKILLLDKVLCVAKYAGERQFTRNAEWAKLYARAVASVLDRPSIRVDVGEHQVG